MIVFFRENLHIFVNSVIFGKYSDENEFLENEQEV
jgi:hypothetical protein